LTGCIHKIKVAAKPLILLLMKKNWELIVLIFLIGANLFLSVQLYEAKSDGFFAPHGDSVPRAIISYGIATGWDFPSASIFKYWKIEGIFPHKVWPPFQFYFNAVVYKISGNLLLSPVISNCIFSIGIIVILYLLIRVMIPDRSILALTGVLIYITFAGFKMIDLSGLDQTMLNFFLIGGLYLWLKYRSSRGKRVFIYLSAIFFLIASSVRFEGWFCVGIFEVFILGEFLSSLRMRFREITINSHENPDMADQHRSFQPSVRCPAKYYLLSVMLIPLLFIILWLIHQQLAYGEFFFLNYHHSEAIAGGDKLYWDKSFIFKLLYYPVLLFKSSPILVSIIMLSLCCIKKYNRISRGYFYFILIEFAILISSLLYVGAPHGTTRIIVTNLLLLLPITIAGLYYFLSVILRERMALGLTVLVFILISIFQFINIPQNLHNSISSEVSQIGYLMRKSVANGTIGKGDHIFVEVTNRQPWGIWDTQKLSLFAPRFAVSMPPLFFDSDSLEKQKTTLEKRKIIFAVVWSEAARERLSKLFSRIYDTAHYSVFIRPDRVQPVEEYK